MVLIDSIVVIIYFLLIAFLIFKNKKASSLEDFAVGGRKIPSTLVFASLAATFLGPGYSMGLANKAAGNGYIWLCIFLAFSLQTLIVGYFIAPRLRAFKNAYTIGDIMRERYGKTLQIITGLFSVAICAGFVGVIAKASGDLISTLTGISFFWSVVISTIFVIIYSTYGGLKSVVLTDVIQFIILSLSIPLILVFIGFDHDLDSLVNSGMETLSANEGMSTISILGLLLAFLFGETLIPPYANRALMAKSEKEAKSGFLKAGAYSIFWFFICSTIGVVSIVLLPDSENPFIGSMQTYLPVGLLGFAIAALISIIMSSQDSILNAASVSFNRDLISNLMKSDSNNRLLQRTRILNVGIGIVATVFAINVPSVVDALLYCYTLWAPTIVLPLIIGVLYKKANKNAALYAILSGGVATGLWEWVLNIPQEIPSILIGLLVNQIVFWSIQLVLNKE